MADAFLGEIRLFPYNYTPQDWLLCDGQQLRAQEYPALLSIFGNIYGGDGRYTFNLPNLNGRVAVGQGLDAPDPFKPKIGQAGGENAVEMSYRNFPPHNHELTGKQLAQAQRSATPDGNMLTGITFRPAAGGTPPTSNPYADKTPSATQVALHEETLSRFAGGKSGQIVPRENRQPALALRWCICVYGGAYPVRPS